MYFSYSYRSFFSDDYEITEINQWHYVAFSFDKAKNKLLLVIDDKIKMHKVTGVRLFDPEDQYLRVLIGGSRHQAPQENFEGGISCVQIYNAFLNEAQIHIRKNCSVVESAKSAKCPQNYEYFDGQCYMISSKRNNFAAAEASCLPDKESRYRSQMAFPPNRQHRDYLARKVFALYGTYHMWVGLDNRAGRNEWQDR